MTSTTRDAPEVSAQAGRLVAGRPRLASGVQLIGELPDTGFTKQQWLVQRGDHFVQVTELLYQIAEHIDGRRTLEDISARVTESSDWAISPDQVRYLLANKLIPAGVVAEDDDTVADAPIERRTSAASPLGVNMRKKVIGAGVIEPPARMLSVLYAPPVLVAVLALAVLAHGWLYAINGVGNSVVAVLFTPGLLLAVMAAMLLASIWHEFGHAAALTYGGGRVRGMGVGFYLMYPAFYTDVTDSYRLGRWARVRTDLGGFYFYLIFALGSIGLYALTGQEWLVVVVLLINADIVRQSLPFVRFDGYWAVADLTGIPDLFSQLAPFARSVSSRAGAGDKLPELKPWVKLVYTLYIAITLPVLLLLLWLMATRLPGLLTVVISSLLSQLAAVPDIIRSGDVIGVGFTVFQILILAFEVAGISYLFVTVGRSLFQVAGAQPTRFRRLLGELVLAGLIALVAWAWIPQLPLARGTEPAGVESLDIAGRAHTREPVAYSRVPPVGGDHSPVVQNCGFYDEPIAAEHAVHSMEHGAVWITYQAGLEGDQSEALRRLAERSHVLVSPYPGVPAPIVASAWGKQLRVNVAGDARLGQFVDAFRLGPQAPEAGGPCTGGTGDPS